MENKDNSFYSSKSGSERFPNKIFYKINNLTLIEILLKRVKNQNI